MNAKTGSMKTVFISILQVSIIIVLFVRPKNERATSPGLPAVFCVIKKLRLRYFEKIY